MSELPSSDVAMVDESSSSVPVVVDDESTKYDSLGPDELKKIFTIDAAGIVKLKIVYSLDDLDSSAESIYAFKPQLVHQVFGFNDCLFGYKDPKIIIYMMANSCKAYLDFTYSKEVPRGSPTLEPDDFLPKLKLWLPENFTQDKEKFIKSINKEDHTKMYGQIFHSFENKTVENKTATFFITECNISERGFIEFHERFQCYFVWFIDAASQIDTTDPNWMFIYLYEEKQIGENEYARYPVGCCTFYKFFNYPDNIRVRISQMLILPPWQRLGLGSKLLEATYNLAKTLPNLVDITVEDPCPEFVKMRDLLDSQILAKLESFKHPRVMQGFTKTMHVDANALIKTNKRQCRRVYEIIRLSHCTTEEDTAKLHAEIKLHFTTPFKRLMSKKRLGVQFKKYQEEELLLEYKEDIKLEMSTYFSSLKEVANRLTASYKK